MVMDKAMDMESSMVVVGKEEVEEVVVVVVLEVVDKEKVKEVELDKVVA